MRHYYTGGHLSRLDEAVWRGYPLRRPAAPPVLHYVERLRGGRPRSRFTRHLHWEMTIVLSGDGALEFPAAPALPMQPHTLLLVPPDTPHREAAPGAVDLIWIGFDLDFLPEFRASAPGAVTSRTLTREAVELWRMLVSGSDRFGLELEGLLYRLVGGFFRLRGTAAPGNLAVRLAELVGQLSSQTGALPPVAEMARLCRCSRSHFSREFKRLTGFPPADYRARLRLRQAERHLRETDLPAAQIAELCGFRDPPYFSRQFRREFGVPPALYRRQVAAAPPTGKKNNPAPRRPAY